MYTIRFMNTAVECMIAVSAGCAEDVVSVWEEAYHAAVTATNNLLTQTCTNACLLEPCRKNGRCNTADNDDGFTCSCQPDFLPPYCAGGTENLD